MRSNECRLVNTLLITRRPDVNQTTFLGSVRTRKCLWWNNLQRPRGKVASVGQNATNVADIGSPRNGRVVVESKRPPRSLLSGPPCITRVSSGYCRQTMTGHGAWWTT